MLRVRQNHGRTLASWPDARIQGREGTHRAANLGIWGPTCACRKDTQEIPTHARSRARTHTLKKTKGTNQRAHANVHTNAQTFTCKRVRTQQNPMTGSLQAWHSFLHRFAELASTSSVLPCAVLALGHGPESRRHGPESRSEKYPRMHARTHARKRKHARTRTNTYERTESNRKGT